MDDKAKKVLEALQAQCVKREYCISDIRRKAVERMEGDRAQAEEIVESLIADRFVDDARYAAFFAREKSSINGWGSVKIRYMLRSKGVSDACINAALQEVDTDKAESRLRKLLAAKWKSLADDPQGKFKLIKFALSRGYEYDQIASAVEETIRDGQS